MNALYETGPNGLWTFVFLTLLLGGAAAMATGRALALTWRPARQCVLYAAPLALTVAFLHFALFEEAVISMERIAEDFAAASGFAAGVASFLWNLRGWAVQFALFAIMAGTGYRLTRVRQMTRQYRFTCRPAGPFFWGKGS